MNKEVIYLEPEDDITDILTKLQQAEQKLVALVPPKKATMLRSAVNMKLVARVAKECEKVVVIVTIDPAVVKMAMAARIPVAKSLQSRPVLPTEENVRAAEAAIQVIDGETGEVSEGSPEDLPEIRDGREKSAKTSKKDQKSEKTNAKMPFRGSKTASEDAYDDKPGDIRLDEKSLSEGSGKRDKSSQKGKKRALGKKTPEDGSFIVKYRKPLLVGAAAVVALIVVLVWAFVFAPSASITVAISSIPDNFSENVTFTTDPEKQDFSQGILYVSEQTLEQKYTAKFTATGEEDKGDKAKGTVTASITFKPREITTSFTRSVDKGNTLVTAEGLEFVVTQGAIFEKYDGNSLPSGCSMNSCTITVDAEVEAKKPGTEYNISPYESWELYDGDIKIENRSSFTGGTTKQVKAVSQSDVDKVAETLVREHESEGKKYLYEDVGDSRIAIDASFKAEAKEKNATPAVGEEVKDNDEPSVTVTVSYSVYTIAKTAIEEYIKVQRDISDTSHLYSIGNPYFERFTAITESARLKTTIETGPIVTEDFVYDKAKGRKTGEVQSIIKNSMEGISSVEVRTSYFWVNTIPEDREKVTITIEAEGRDAGDEE